ncbi:transcriptional regulator [Candidatus Saccharibacteria bacterium]|jgi:hypothetical protein|nr:transcriptional regulator [Candidatus Saccharibacteria bacterium]
MVKEKKTAPAIDGLFGSKTRVKLLHLFFNNPGRAFYVREITRIIDEQINSVRRELANLLNVGVIKSSTADNKLYYEVSQTYEHFSSFREIFCSNKTSKKSVSKVDDLSNINNQYDQLASLPGIRALVLSGILVDGSIAQIDLLVAGSTAKTKVIAEVKQLEKAIGRELNFAFMTYDELYYRISLKDRFISEIIGTKHTVLVDTDGILQ